MTGKKYCWFHDPRGAEKRRADRVKGGQIRTKIIDKPIPNQYRRDPVKIGSVKDILGLLTETINEVRNGTIEKPTANSIGYLSNVAIKCLEQVEIMKRLEAIEAEISKIKEDSYERRK